MLNWMKTMVGKTTVNTTECGIYEEPQLSRQEVSELFADLLERPVLQKRTEASRAQPRRLMAGRQPQSA